MDPAPVLSVAVLSVAVQQPATRLLARPHICVRNLVAQLALRPWRIAAQVVVVREQLDGLKKRLSGDAGATAVLDSAEALRKKIDAVEEKIIQPKSKSGEDPLNYPIQVTNQLMDLQDTVESADTVPTAQSYVVFDELNGRLETQLTAWREVKAKDLMALNDLIRKNNIEAIAPAREKTKVAAE